MKLNLREAYPNLALFAQMDWDAVAAEYEKTSNYISFPEYLELKYEEGDCPGYLFELAYFDSALTNIMSEEFIFPDEGGVHLNPSVHFLSFDHDILAMVKNAVDGKMGVVERTNVLGVYLHEDGEIGFYEINEEELLQLQAIENGSYKGDTKALATLVDAGLVLVN